MIQALKDALGKIPLHRWYRDRDFPEIKTSNSHIVAVVPDHPSEDLLNYLVTFDPPRVKKILAVVEAAEQLCHSGYDGPFIGEVCEPLFSALTDLENDKIKPKDERPRYGT